MKGSMTYSQVREADYKKSISLGDDYEARNESELCIHDYLEMAQADWLKAYFRFRRQTWTIPAWEVQHLEALLAESCNMTESIAIALRLADMEGSGDWFKQACKLAQTSTIGQLEQALYELKTKDAFIEVVLSVVHYELFNSFEIGDCVASVEIVRANGKVMRKFVHP